MSLVEKNRLLKNINCCPLWASLQEAHTEKWTCIGCRMVWVRRQIPEGSTAGVSSVVGLPAPRPSHGAVCNRKSWHDTRLLNLTRRLFRRALLALLFTLPAVPRSAPSTLQLLNRTRIFPSHPRAEPETFGYCWEPSGICKRGWWGCLQLTSPLFSF